MSVPGFQSFMVPLLQLAQNGDEQRVHDAIAVMAEYFKLSEEDQAEMLPSGQQTTLSNRVNWALTFLRKARLLESTGRARFRITQRGLDALYSGVDYINVNYLMQFPEFAEFRARRKTTQERDQSLEAESQSDQTPEETMEGAYQALREKLAQELLEVVKRASPQFFERLVVDLLVAMGYGGSRRDAGEAVGRSGDGGIDGIIKEDRLGLDAIYIQAKRWEGNVGRPVVQNFSGSLDGVKARKGILITTSDFTNEAEDYVKRIDKKIVLINGNRLAQLMIDFNIGVVEGERYILKSVNNDYFDEI